jgi:hypothetical protein
MMVSLRPSNEALLRARVRGAKISVGALPHFPPLTGFQSGA